MGCERTGYAGDSAGSGGSWQQDRGTLDVTLAQGAPPFALRVPLRLVGADGAVSQQVAELTTARATVPLKLEKPPQSVVLGSGLRDAAPAAGG